MAKRNPLLLKRGFVGLIVVASVALALTTATPDGTKTEVGMEKSLLADSNVPVPVRAILQRACQDCHSANTIWPWYARVPPISWQIHRHVTEGRAVLDLSRWNDFTEDERWGFRVAIGAAIQSHRMPPREYVWMHREARLSGDDLELVKAWAFAQPKTSPNTLGSQTPAQVRAHR